MNVVLLGAPGSGKGTQAGTIVKKYGVIHISTGDMFREEIAKGTELGAQVADCLKSGRLVPDELTIEIVKVRMARPDCRQGFLMDGFPRTLAQAEALDAYLASVQWKLDAVICLEMSEAEAVRRLSNRRQCSQCGRIYNLVTQPPQQADRCDADNGPLVQREDDWPSTIQKRLMVFQDLTQPLMSYYRGTGLLKTVNADRDPQAVSQSIDAVLAPLSR
jgi:adenylate kinase